MKGHTHGAIGGSGRKTRGSHGYTKQWSTLCYTYSVRKRNHTSKLRRHIVITSSFGLAAYVRGAILNLVVADDAGVLLERFGSRSIARRGSDDTEPACPMQKHGSITV